MIEAVPLLLVCIHMSSSILGQVVELVNVVHHGHTPLPKVQKLYQLSIENTSRNIIFFEGRCELLSGHPMIRLLHGIECITPCTCGPQQLLRCKAHFLLIGHVEQQELLL